MEINNEKKRIPLYVLNNFIKFERKLYQFAGLPLGRAIRLKTVIYFLVTLIIGVVIYFTPVINVAIRWMQPAVLIMIPAGVAWVLSDLGTEDRSPMKFFRSYLRFNFKRLTGGAFYRNKRISKLRTYSFSNFISYSSNDYATNIGVMKFENTETDNDEQEKIITHEKEEVNEPALKEIPSNELAPVTSNYDLTSHLFGDNTNLETKKEVPAEITAIIEKAIDSTGDKQEEVKVTEHLTSSDEPLIVDSPTKEEDKIVKRESEPRSRRFKKAPKAKVKGSQLGGRKRITMIASVTFGLVAVLIVSLLAFDLMGTKGSSPKTLGNESVLSDEEQQEENLLKGIRQASMQDYEEAVLYFDNVDFSLLDQEDKEIVLLSYLFTDQVEKTLDLDPEFDEVVSSYYVAKDNVSKLRSYADRSDEFKFVLAVNDRDYQTILDLKSVVFIDEEREEYVVHAYVELDKLEEALKFAEEKDNQRLINQVEQLIEENKDSIKEKTKDE